MDIKLDAIDTSAAEVGVEIPLSRVDGSPLLNAKGEPVTLTLVGADSKAYRTITRKHARMRVDRSRKLKGDLPIDDKLLDELEDESLELLVACTKGWSGVLDSKDQPVKFTPEACDFFYRNFPIAREQADRAIVERAHFIKAS